MVVNGALQAVEPKEALLTRNMSLRLLQVKVPSNHEKPKKHIGTNIRRAKEAVQRLHKLKADYLNLVRDFQAHAPGTFEAA